MGKKSHAGRVRLRPADPFDLIRLIARSQSDPRKAVAELVQNSLDAGAREIRLTWFTHQKFRALSIYDDGEGVFPDLDRPAALKKIATTIGHSHKARLTPAERHRQMTLGKYGIGLLGFWALAKRMEIRSRVNGSEVWVLELAEEEREARVRRRRTSRLPLEPTMTEVVLTHIHPIADQQVKPRRLAAYLAGELRGQLLDREVLLEIHDRVGRGRAQKRRVVKPLRYQGIHLEAIRELTVPGFASARVDLYLIPEAEDRHGRASLACGGATVLEDLAVIDGVDAPRPPWVSGRFEGVVDFPDLTVAPSSRRSFVPDEAARAFLEALPDLEARLANVLLEDAERVRRDREADDAGRIRKLFRRLPRHLPDYALFEILDGEEPGSVGGAASGVAIPEGVAEGSAVQAEEGGEAVLDEQPDTEFFYPPGPLVSVEVRPRRSVLAPGGERGLRAVGRDADGRVITEELAGVWRLEGPGELLPDGDRALYRAPDDPGEARVVVEVHSNAGRAEGEGSIRVTDAAERASGRDAGIPDPEPFPAPAEPWRSRLLDGRWQYNSAHPDYRRIQDDRRRRLSYLVHLFAKELVLRNFGEPDDGVVLERMVQVLTHVDPGRRRR